MINALICAYKSGDVIGLALSQLLAEPAVTRVIVADGPHRRPPPGGHLVDKPTVEKVVKGFRSPKVIYEYSDDCENRAVKMNRALRHITPDCKWALTVDSDEVYHEDDLPRLATFLGTAPFGRYSIKTVDFYPDFHHQLKLPDWKPRLYRWYPGARCRPYDRGFSYILHPKQKLCDNDRPHRMALMPKKVCHLYHLNALRAASDRVRPQPDGTVIWKGGGQMWPSPVARFKIHNAPKCIRELGRSTL